jgi:hypothetical protein
MRSAADIESYIKTTANFDNAINDIKKILLFVLEQQIKDADKNSNSIIEQIASRRRNISNLVEELKNEIVSNEKDETRTSSVEMWQPVEVFKRAHYLKNRLHSLNETSKIDQIQLQRMLDNYSKTMSMIYEIMRKICQTEDSIIGNIK